MRRASEMAAPYATIRKDLRAPLRQYGATMFREVPQSMSAAIDSAPPARARILLVEDDDAVRRSLQLLLTSRGYDVRAYRTGEGLAKEPEALSAACLVADLMMPEGDALQLLHGLRAAGWKGPSVLISGHLTDEWASQAEAAGYDAVLPKPIGESVLVGWIARLLDRSTEG